MAPFTFWCECWCSQGHSVISLVFLLAFLRCGVYSLHFRTCSALNTTHFLLFLEQLQIQYPSDDKVIDNMDFKYSCNWKPCRAGIDSDFTPEQTWWGPQFWFLNHCHSAQTLSLREGRREKEGRMEANKYNWPWLSWTCWLNKFLNTVLNTWCYPSTAALSEPFVQN